MAVCLYVQVGGKCHNRINKKKKKILYIYIAKLDTRKFENIKI